MTNYQPNFDDVQPNYAVRIELEVRASSPEQAATIARDMMLDPMQWLHANVHPMEWVAEAEEWFPAEKRGWSVWFRQNTVRPTECVEWLRLE